MTRERIAQWADWGIVYALCGLAFFIPISKAAIEICLWLGVFCFAVKKTCRPDAAVFKTSPHIFLALFFIFCGLSLFNSGSLIGTSLIALFFKWLKYIMVFLIVEDTLNRKRLHFVLGVLLVSAGIASTEALFQRFLGVEFLRQRPLMITDQHLYAVTASFKHYNDFGAYLVAVSLLPLALIFSPSVSGKVRFAAGVLGILLGASLLLTLSRGAWLGLFCGLILFLVLTRKYMAIGLVGLLFFLAIFFLPGAREKFAFTFQPTGDAQRFEIWEIAWEMIQKHPWLGRGLGTFMGAFREYKETAAIQYVHNCYLQIWAETGILALFSFMVFIAITVGKAIKSFLEKRDFLLLGFLCGIFGLLVHSFFDTQLYSLQLAVLFWFFLGLVSMLSRGNNACRFYR